MRILYLNPCGQMGGAEISLLDLLSSLRTAEPDWELWLILGEDGPLAAKARNIGVEVIIAPFPRALAHLGDAGQRPMTLAWTVLKAVAGTILYARNMARMNRMIRPDLIHTNGFKMHVLGVWGRRKSTPVIWHIRDYVSSRVLMKRLLRGHAANCAVAIANSESVQRDVQSVCGPALEVHTIYNAVDLTRYSPQGPAADLDALSGLEPVEPETVRIGLVATLARWKGHAVFLKALARLPRDVRYRAYVVGGRIYQTENSQYTLDELRALASQLNIAGRIGFTGFVQDTAAALRALDIVVHASTQPEPFGRVIAEAMASGRPIICSAAGGAAELITEGQDALAHPPGDEAALAGQIAALATNPELRQRMGRAGRATAERRFAPERLATELIPIYRRLRGQSAPRARTQAAVVR